jgi:hypothetical protein
MENASGARKSAHSATGLMGALGQKGTYRPGHSHLDDRLTQTEGEGQMEIQLEKVTPRKAEQWLNVNKNNRKMRDGVAEKYADEMRNHRWTQCPEPIAFYDDGDLADGQHRLWAVLESGRTIEFPVARGLTRADGLNLNTGMGRTLVDNAKISGSDASLSNELLSIARAVAQGKCSNGKTPLSNSQRLEMVGEHRAAVDWAISNGPRGRGLRNAMILGAIARAWYWEPDKDRMKRFCDVFTSGFSDGEEETAAIALRNYYLTKPAIASAALWVDTFLKSQNAIFYFMKARKLTIIKGIEEEQYPLKKKRK